MQRDARLAAAHRPPQPPRTLVVGEQDDYDCYSYYGYGYTYYGYTYSGSTSPQRA